MTFLCFVNTVMTFCIPSSNIWFTSFFYSLSAYLKSDYSLFVFREYCSDILHKVTWFSLADGPADKIKLIFD